MLEERNIEENYRGFAKVKQARDFLMSIGFKVKTELTEVWNLDTCVVLVPEFGTYTITFRDQERYIMKVNIYVAGGIHVEISGKFGNPQEPYQTIPTDYNFNCNYEEYKFFKNEIRERKIDDLFS